MRSQYDGEYESAKMIKTVFKWVIAIFIFVLIFFGAFYTIPAGYRGVVLTFGKPADIVSSEGLHFKIPLVQTVAKIEVRKQKIETQASSSSKDLQDVQTTIALNFHLNPSETNKLYQEIGLGYADRIINPAIQESVKSITAKFTAEELITRRPEVRAGIQEQLTERLSKYYITVDDFNIVNFQFSEEFNKAIEQKVTAEQLKLKADRDLERIRVEAEQKVTQAQAEADSIRIQSEALKQNQDILQLRFIEKWDGILPKVMGSGNINPFIDVNAL